MRRKSSKRAAADRPAGAGRFKFSWLSGGFGLFEFDYHTQTTYTQTGSGCATYSLDDNECRTHNGRLKSEVCSRLPSPLASSSQIWIGNTSEDLTGPLRAYYRMKTEEGCTSELDLHVSFLCSPGPSSLHKPRCPTNLLRGDVPGVLVHLDLIPIQFSTGPGRARRFLRIRMSPGCFPQ